MNNPFLCGNLFPNGLLFFSFFNLPTALILIEAFLSIREYSDQDTVKYKLGFKKQLEIIYLKTCFIFHLTQSASKGFIYTHLFL